MYVFILYIQGSCTPCASIQTPVCLEQTGSELSHLKEGDYIALSKENSVGGQELAVTTDCSA